MRVIVRDTDGSPDGLGLPHQALGFRVQAYGVTQHEVSSKSMTGPICVSKTSAGTSLHIHLRSKITYPLSIPSFFPGSLEAAICGILKNQTYSSDEINS